MPRFWFHLLVVMGLVLVGGCFNRSTEPVSAKDKGPGRLSQKEAGAKEAAPKDNPKGPSLIPKDGAK
jgi:hypothetical protein